MRELFKKILLEQSLQDGRQIISRLKRLNVFSAVESTPEPIVLMNFEAHVRKNECFDIPRIR